MVKGLIFKLADQYVHFSLAGKPVQIPYSMVYYPGETYDPELVTRTTRFKHFAGKGTPEQIKQAVQMAAAQNKFNLQQASSAEIHQFMLDQGIGIDCSGFVYNVLDRYLRHIGLDLGSSLLRYPGMKGKLENLLFRINRVRRISAETLTNDLNTVKINKVKDIQPGDMIRLTDPHWHGKHIALIVHVNPTSIIYAHASERTTEVGPHFAVIEIVDPERGLERQRWLEKLRDGRNYGKVTYRPKRGDSVRRLKVLYHRSLLGRPSALVS